LALASPAGGRTAGAGAGDGRSRCCDAGHTRFLSSGS
jgi:hypothetical protein